MVTNDERDTELYRYPNSDVLRNLKDIRDAAALEKWELTVVTARIEQGVPSGDFDLNHLKAIHKHLFQDVYPWAGEIRQTDIAKTTWFHSHDRIEMGMADVHRHLVESDYLQGLSRKEFAGQAGEIIGNVNFCHSFREGNGRTQFQYLKQLGERAGHSIDLTRFKRDTWIEASIDANRAKYEKMASCIDGAISRSRGLGRGSGMSL